MEKLLSLIAASILLNVATAQNRKDTTGRKTGSFHRLDDITIISGYNKFNKKETDDVARLTASRVLFDRLFRGLFRSQPAHDRHQQESR